MHDLTFSGSARTAAYHILDKTPLQWTLDYSGQDDTKTLTLSINADVWERLSSGERVLVGVLEQLAGQRSTVTIQDVGHRLDEDCRRAVIDAYEMFLMGRAA